MSAHDEFVARFCIPHRDNFSVKGWQRKALTHEIVGFGNGKRCAYCGTPIGPRSDRATALWAMDHLVPLQSGGPRSDSDDLVPACTQCNSNKGPNDWLLFGKALDPEGIKAIRLRMLARSLNHLMPDPSAAWTKLQIGRVLQQRWQHPRSAFIAACTAEGAFIGVRPLTRLNPETIAVLFGYPKEQHGPSRPYSVWCVPREKFLEVVWQLIALNAYVRRLDLGSEFPDATPQDNADLARWAETYWNIGEIVLRREYRIREDWHPNRRYPRREPGAPEYKRPVKNPRGPRQPMTQAEIDAKVDDLMKDSHPNPMRALGPRQRELAAQRDDYDRALLDLGFRMLAYSLDNDGEEMPWEEPLFRRFDGDGARRAKPQKKRKPVKRLTPKQRRERRAAAIAAGLPPPKRAWP